MSESVPLREFDDSDVDALVDIPTLVDEVDRCLADLRDGDARQSPKSTLPMGDDGFFLSVAGVVPRLGLATAKWASYAPGSAGAAGVSTSTITVSSTDAGRPLAIVSGMRATHLRTAATAAAVVRRWQAGGTGILALIGFGPTNRTVLEVLERLGHPVGELRIAVRSPESAATIADELPHAIVTTDPAAAVRGASLAISATGGTSALCSAADLAAGGLVVSLDGLRTWSDHEQLDLVDDRGTETVTSFAVALESGPIADQIAVFDIAGSAVTDVALVAQLVAVTP